MPYTKDQIKALHAQGKGKLVSKYHKDGAKVGNLSFTKKELEVMDPWKQQHLFHFEWDKLDNNTTKNIIELIDEGSFRFDNGGKVEQPNKKQSIWDYIWKNDNLKNKEGRWKNVKKQEPQHKKNGGWSSLIQKQVVPTTYMNNGGNPFMQALLQIPDPIDRYNMMKAAVSWTNQNPQKGNTIDNLANFVHRNYQPKTNNQVQQVPSQAVKQPAPLQPVQVVSPRTKLGASWNVPLGNVWGAEVSTQGSYQDMDKGKDPYNAGIKFKWKF